MSRTPLLHHWGRIVALLGVIVLAVGILPAGPVSAAIVTKTVDDTLTDFTRGTFQRTSLAAPTVEPDSELGAVQLSRDGVLQSWLNSPFRLPENLTDIGAAAVGNRIYVVGGTASSKPSSRVYWTQIDQTTGAPTLADPNDQTSAWRKGEDLPAIQAGIVQSSQDCTKPVAARASSAVTAVTTSNNAGYIYVMGGGVICNTKTISSFGVNIGKVDGASGAIAWSEGPRLPLETKLDDGTVITDGVQLASAVSLTSSDGSTYVYLIGGLRTFYNGTTLDNLGSARVFCAKVDPSSGLLVKPSSGGQGWDETSAVPVPSGSTSGIWDAAAIGSNFVNAGPAIFLMGGQVKPSPNDTNRYSSVAYRAKIGGNGALTWDVAGNLPNAQVALGAVENHGKLYLTGGESANDANNRSVPQKTVMGSYVDDNLNLPNYNGANFATSNDTQFLPRARHGAVVVTATPTKDEPNAAYIYMIAGIDEHNASTNTLIYGKVGGVEDTNSNTFVATGWFYSAPYEIVFNGAQVQEIDWKTAIPSPGAMDIKMEYRVSTSVESCSSSTAFNGATWQPLDATPNDGSVTYSTDGANAVSLNRPSARCFQYRANLTTSNVQTTPALLMVSIKVFLPGAPDLTVSKLAPINNDRQELTGLDIEITNNNTSGDPTLAANEDGLPDGTFFVDLWIFAPGETVQVPTIPVPQTSDTGSKAYVQIPKSQMGAGTTLTIPNDQWCPTKPASENDTCPTKLSNLLSFFPKSGTYKVVVAVDSLSCGISNVKGCVDESSSGGEDNNLSQVVDIDVKVCTSDCVKINLPFIARP